MCIAAKAASSQMAPHLRKNICRIDFTRPLKKSPYTGKATTPAAVVLLPERHTLARLVHSSPCDGCRHPDGGGNTREQRLCALDGCVGFEQGHVTCIRNVCSAGELERADEWDCALAVLCARRVEQVPKGAEVDCPQRILCRGNLGMEYSAIIRERDAGCCKGAQLTYAEDSQN